MKYPAMTAMPADFLSRWSVWYPTTPPVGFLLRAAYHERWLRIHSLPGSKRYPTSPSEYAELLLRHNMLATDVLGGEGARCAVLVRAACGGRWSRRIGARAALTHGDLPLVHRLPHGLEQQGVFAEPICLFGGSCTWHAGTFDGFLRASADDKVKGLIVELARGQAYSPYDGGADVFFVTTAERDAARQRYRHWLPENLDGL